MNSKLSRVTTSWMLLFSKTNDGWKAQPDGTFQNEISGGLMDILKGAGTAAQ